MNDTLANHAKRASDILHPYTTQDDNAKGIQRAVNDACNVLQWGKTCAEEVAEAIHVYYVYGFPVGDSGREPMTEQEEDAYLKRLDTRTKDLKRWMENGIPLDQIEEETDLRNPPLPERTNHEA